MNAVIALLSPYLGEIVTAALGLIAVLFAFLRGVSSGKQREQTKQLKESLQNERTREDLESSLRTTPPGEREQLRAPWYRN